MRQLFRVLASVFLCVTFFIVSCSAEEPVITFRDLDWGCSFDEAKSHLPDEQWKITLNERGTKVENYVITDDDEFDFPVQFSAYLSWPEIKVAGVKPRTVSLHFAYLPDDSGYINTESTQYSALISGSYLFDPVKSSISPAAMEENLIEKLTNLYGTPTQYSEKEGSYDMYYTVWMVNGVKILLRHSHHRSLDEHFVFLYYGWLKGNDYLNDAETILLNQSKTSYDGL